MHLSLPYMRLQKASQLVSLPTTVAAEGIFEWGEANQFARAPESAWPPLGGEGPRGLMKGPWLTTDPEFATGPLEP